MNLDRECLEELHAMRSDLKEWMEKDVKNHYDKDKKVTELLERVIMLLEANSALKSLNPNYIYDEDKVEPIG